MDVIRAHWTTIAYALGAWTLVASMLNKVQALNPAPDAAWWKRALHGIFVDLPAFLPKVNFKGLFGLPVNVPYLTLSRAPDDKPTDAPKMIVFALLAGAALGGCTELNAYRLGTGISTVLSGGGDVVTALDKSTDADVISMCQSASSRAGCEAARAKLSAWEKRRAIARGLMATGYATLLGLQGSLAIYSSVKGGGGVNIADVEARLAALLVALTKGLAELGVTLPGSSVRVTQPGQGFAFNTAVR